MKQDQEKTTEKTDVPICFKHGTPINMDLTMCEDCWIEIVEKHLKNFGEYKIVIPQDK